MAQKYRKIDPRIWDDEVFDTLDAHQALAVLWLESSNAVNRAGVVTFGLGEALDKWRLKTLEEARETLVAVCQKLDWSYEIVGRSTVIVILRTWFRYNPPSNHDHLKGMLSDLKDVPRCDTMAKSYAIVRQYLTDTYLETFDTVWRELGYTVPGPRTSCPPHQEAETGAGAGAEAETESSALRCAPSKKTIRTPNQCASKSIDWDFAEAMAIKAATKVPPEKPSDAVQLVKAAALAISRFGEGWFADAVYATSLKATSNKPRYLNGVLRSKAREAGADFKAILRSLDAPKSAAAYFELLRAPPARRGATTIGELVASKVDRP